MSGLGQIVAISLIAGTVAAGLTWLLWSLFENLLAPAAPKRETPKPDGAE